MRKTNRAVYKRISKTLAEEHQHADGMIVRQMVGDKHTKVVEPQSPLPKWSGKIAKEIRR